MACWSAAWPPASCRQCSAGSCPGCLAESLAAGLAAQGRASLAGGGGRAWPRASLIYGRPFFPIRTVDFRQPDNPPHLVANPQFPYILFSETSY